MQNTYNRSPRRGAAHDINVPHRAGLVENGIEQLFSFQRNLCVNKIFGVYGSGTRGTPASMPNLQKHPATLQAIHKNTKFLFLPKKRTQRALTPAPTRCTTPNKHPPTH